MSEWWLRWFMQGKSIDEIVERCREPKPTPQMVRETMIQDREKFEKTCIRMVFENAQKGQIDAIEWLSKRGLFDQVRSKDGLDLKG